MFSYLIVLTESGRHLPVWDVVIEVEPRSCLFFCRVFRTTFLNDFQRESAASFLSPKVAAEDYKRGLITRITFDISANQRVEIYLWPDRETADKTWQEFGEPLSHKLRETGARMERFEGYVDNFDINPATDFKALITEFETG